MQGNELMHVDKTSSLAAPGRAPHTSLVVIDFSTLCKTSENPAFARPHGAPRSAGPGRRVVMIAGENADDRGPQPVRLGMRQLSEATSSR